MDLLHITIYVCFERLYDLRRHASETDTTVSTDEDCTWGGIGKYEYSGRSLPHALTHARELVERGGHHGAFCTSVAESSHKHNIKLASLYARAFENHNTTQEHMLVWVLRQLLWDAVQNIHEIEQGDVPASLSQGSEGSAEQASHKVTGPLNYTNGWTDDVVFDRRGRTTPRNWLSAFLSRKVLVTRQELISLLLLKLAMDYNVRNVERIVQGLKIRCYGTITMESACGTRRKIVGINHAGRRDFMRLRGDFDDTTLSVQVIMFLQIDGFSDEDIKLPIRLRNPRQNNTSVVLALVRWLSPHPNSDTRDFERRPVAPSPFDINHSIWQFTKIPHRRPVFATPELSRQLHLFSGSNENERLAHSEMLCKAHYDLVVVESFDYFMNCTYIDDDQNTILETNTLPFD